MSQIKYLGKIQDQKDLVTKEYVDNGLSGKQDTISDLDDIRSGAALGTTSLQSDDVVEAETVTLAEVATSGSYNDLTNKPSIPIVPTAVSAFTNDAGYLTLATLPVYDGSVV